MIKRLTTLLILLPIGIIVIAMAVANRQFVTLAVPPQLADGPLFSMTMPLFALLFVVLLAGMVIGSCATWVKQGKHRKQARANKVEATKLAFEVQKTKAESGIKDIPTADAEAIKALRLPSPAKAA